MSQSTNILKLISETLEKNIKDELLVEYPSRAYDGRLKPISGKYPTPRSNKISSGRLYNGVYVDFENNPQGQTQVKIGFQNAPEWRWVNDGRRGKVQNPALKYPPLASIDRWLVQKPGLGLGIRDARGRFQPRKSIRYLVQRSIGEYGIYPTKFIEKALEKSMDYLITNFGLYAAGLLQEFIQNNIIITTAPKQ